jgi:hypothetical protein
VNGQYRFRADVPAVSIFRIKMSLANKTEEPVNDVRFKVFTAVTLNAVFWDIKTQFTPHMRHISSPLQSLAG